MKVPCILVALVVCIAAAQRPNTVDRDDWVEPHLWSRTTTLKRVPSVEGESSGGQESCICDVCQTCPATLSESPSTGRIRQTENHGEFLYRKLVNFLINERRMKYDQVSDQFHRTVHIHLSRQQYERIRNQGGDLRDIDGVLQDIWKQSKQGNIELMREVLWSWSESVQNFWSELVANRVMVNSLQFGMIVLAYLWAKHRGLSVGLISWAATAFYVYRYLDGECHRKLDIARIADLLNRDERNPCEEENPSWFGALFGGNRRDECIEFLNSRTEKTCTIKDIYEGFLREFVMDGMSMFFETFARILSNIKDSYGWIGMIVVSVLMYANFGVLITAIFKYVISPLITNFRQPNQHHQRYEPTTPHQSIGEHLSGPMIERLLTITESSTKLANALSEKLQLKPSTSGVEILARENSAPAILQAPPTIGDPFPVVAKVIHANYSSSSSVQSLPLPDSGNSSKGPCSSKSSSVIAESEIGSTDEGDRNSLDEWQGDSASEDDIVILEHFEETEISPQIPFTPEKPT